MAAISEYLGSEENRFRAITYQRVAQMLESLPEDITEYIKKNDLTKVHGIGRKTLEKIEEFVRTGTIKKYEELKKQIPPDFIELMEVPGLGARTLRQLHDELGVRTREELIEALRSGRAARLKGMGPKKIEKILHGLELAEKLTERILYWTALTIARTLIAEMRQRLGEKIAEVEVAGSLRRGKETVGDIDILVACVPEHAKHVVDTFTALGEVVEVLMKGDTKASVLAGQERRQVDLRVIKPQEWGAALQYFTGSKEHNVRLRELARQRNLKVNEYGVFTADTGERLCGATEEEVYETLGMQWVPPEMREDRGEIELATRRAIPQLVKFEHIRGDMQMHSTWSDGRHSIRDIALYIAEHFPQYEYILITDHSQSVRVANGLTPERFLAQFEEIKRVNAELGGKPAVKAGCEVDILPDGRLDLPDELLAKFDFVVASIHSRFNMDNTERLVAACRHPYVNAIGHPTGRLIGMRDSYPLNLERVVEAAVKTGTALEINGQPDRMDLPDILAHRAREAGAYFILSTDAHFTGNFQYMEIAVKVARRAWLTPAHILNTRPWEEIEEWKAHKKKLLAAG